MPMIEPISPSAPLPQFPSSVSCPHCGYVNQVSSDQFLRGFKCGRCGQKVNGYTGGKPNPGDSSPIKVVACPNCKNEDRIEHLSGNENGKRFRCKACGTEF